MREADLNAVVEALREPIREYVRESRVRIALLISSSGQVVAQHGFGRSYELINIAALAAAANSAAQALAQMSEAGRWRYMHQAGGAKQLFLAPMHVVNGELILVAIFDEQSSVGLAEYFFQRLSEQLRGLPVFASTRPTSDPIEFERDLEAGVERVFGKHEQHED
ncbi:MAG: roadblock/LC7 domain-containing protein [Longimicrobiales bacterium]